MCLFSGPVRHVSGTRIYAGPRDNGASGAGSYQRIAYEMTVELPAALAMVLPIPTPPSPAEDAVKFVDLSSCPTLLFDLDELFPPDAPSFGGAPLARSGGFGPPQTLVVHDVGDFEASFVPTLADFARLDARFRMPNDVWSQLPQYADWSFCVFELKPDPPPAKTSLLDRILNRAPAPPSFPKPRHPMAFDFPRRNAKEIFFPTVHVHDGAVHAEADFDHTLFAQLDDPALPEGWDRPAAGTEALPERARSFVRPERPVFRKRLRGAHPNRDVIL